MNGLSAASISGGFRKITNSGDAVLAVINAKTATAGPTTMMTRARLRYSLEESATLFMLAGLNSAIIITANLTDVKTVFFLNIALMTFIFTLPRLQHRWKRPAMDFLRDWYLLPVLIAVYLQLGVVIPAVNPGEVDEWLIRIDRLFFFGHDPTVLLEPFAIPPVTELLQIVYASFYLLPLSLCVIVYAKRRREVFHTVVSAIVIGFYISYIGYLITPAIGPRYTLAYLQNIELSGLWSFGFIRTMLDQASGMMRDCCPSGHTMIGIVTFLLAWRYERKFAPVALIWAAVIVFSTVYLRYHYVIDVLAGFVLAFAFLPLFPLIEKCQFTVRDP